MPERIIRVRDVNPKNGLPSHVTVKRWEEDGLFPRRRAFGPGVVGWFETEFYEALNAMAEHRRVQDEQTRRRSFLSKQPQRATATATHVATALGGLVNVDNHPFGGGPA